jgi:hypothetical protein
MQKTMIGRLRRHMFEQVGINRCLLRTLAQIGTGRDRDQPHFAHILCHRLLIDGMPIAMQLRSNLAIPVIRMLCIDRINAMLERYFAPRDGGSGW